MQLKKFCKRLTGAVNIASTYHKDVNGWTEDQKIKIIFSNDRHSQIGPEELTRKWNIGIHIAKETLEVTTQHGVRTAVQPMSRWLRVDHLHLHRSLLQGTWFADTLMSKVNSIRGNKCANVFTQGNLTKFSPWRHAQIQDSCLLILQTTSE